MERKLSGASMFQYLIIICIVALGITPCFYLMGDKINESLAYFQYKMAENNEVVSENTSPNFNSILNGNVTGGQLGGTANNPVRQCAGSNCTIDFGPIVLNNIPRDYSEIIETSGASGGTEVVVGLIQQIAEQLEDNPQVTEEQLTKIQEIVAYGNDIKNLELLFEGKYKNLLNYKDELAQYSSTMSGLWDKRNTGVITTQQFDAQRTSLTAQYKPYIDMYNKDIHGTSEVSLGGEVRNITLWENFVLLNPEAVVTDRGYDIDITQPEYRFELDTYLSYLSKDKVLGQINDGQKMSPVGEFMQRMLDLSEDDMNPEALELTQTLSKEIFDISQAVRTNIDVFGLHLTSYNPEYAYNRNLYDPIYGGDPRYRNTGTTVFEIVTNNNMLPSETTRMDLNIICSSNSGNYDDSNGSCKKKPYKR